MISAVLRLFRRHKPTQEPTPTPTRRTLPPGHRLAIDESRFPKPETGTMRAEDRERQDGPEYVFRFF